jgi:hypothetical protein
MVNIFLYLSPIVTIKKAWQGRGQNKIKFILKKLRLRLFKLLWSQDSLF